MSLYIQVPIQQIADGLTAIGWSSGGGGGDASLSYGATAPSAPINGTLWWDTTATLLKLYTGGTWTTINVSAETIATISGYASTAQSAASTATQKLTEFKAIQVTATTLSAESSATATFNASTGVLTLGIPQGIQGIAGAVMSVAGRTGDVTLTTTDIGGLDTALGLKANVADVPTSGNPTFTGIVTAPAIAPTTITGLKETSVAMGANNIDLSLGNLFTKTIAGATTLTVSNVPASGTVGYFILKLTNGGAGAVTYPTGTKWSKGTAPTLTASGIDMLRFITNDGGTRWEASRIQEDSK